MLNVLIYSKTQAEVLSEVSQPLPKRKNFDLI